MFVAQSRSSTTFAAMAALACASSIGCVTFDDHMRAGRYEQACRMRYEDFELTTRFERWADENASVDVRLVPEAEVEALLGGPVAQYGVSFGLYEFSGTAKGGVLADLRPEGTRPVRNLVTLMEPLVTTAEPDIPLGPFQRKELEPEPPRQPAPQPSTTTSPSPLLGLFVDLAADVGKAIGTAVGLSVGIPTALTLGMVIGGIEVVRDLARPKLSEELSLSIPSTPQFDPFELVPVLRIKVPKPQARFDALIDEREHAALAERRRVAWEARNAAIDAERIRRASWVAHVGDSHSLCEKERCWYGIEPGKVDVYGRIAFGKGMDECSSFMGTRTLVTPAPASPRPAWPPPAAEPPMRVLDEQAPSWGIATAVTTEMPVGAPAAALAIETLHCTAKVKKAAYTGKTPPALAVRITVGKEIPRVQRWMLGSFKKEARFLAPGVNLQPGERLRLGFSNESENRWLGGGIVEFTGRLPLVVANEAVEASCTEAPPEALRQTTEKLGATAAASVEELHRGLAAKDAEAAAKSREAARLATTVLAMHAGWASAPVEAVRKRLGDVDPAEAPAASKPAAP